MAKAFGVSVRTIQRDRALAIKRTLDKMRKAKVEGRELNVQELFSSELGAKYDEREKAIMKTVADWSRKTTGPRPHQKKLERRRRSMGAAPLLGIGSGPQQLHPADPEDPVDDVFVARDPDED